MEPRFTVCWRYVAPVKSVRSLYIIHDADLSMHHLN